MALPPLSRRLLLGTIDVLLVPLAIWFSFWLRTSEPLSAWLLRTLWLFPATWAIALGVYAFTGQYRGLTRYVSSAAIYAVGLRNAISVMLVALLGTQLPVQMPPHSIWPLLWLVLTVLTGGVRFALRDLLLQANKVPKRRRTRVVIYGAGVAGAQLAVALRLAGSHTVVAVLDDEPSLWLRELDSIKIFPPQRLASLIERHQIEQVLLAIPSLSRHRRRQIVDSIQQLGIPVLQVPSIEDIASRRARITSLRPISIEELLGRDPVLPKPELLGPGIFDKTVLVSGAGGSIGSELCRQILCLKPRRLVLLERSEPSLYAIDRELASSLPDGVDVVPVLGSAANRVLVERTLQDHAVEVIFHAAAYKHVPMVEANPLAGLNNNLLATHVIARAAIAAGVESFTLISTDKAVRPTNVMGASKRSAELVVQGLAQELEVASAVAGWRSPTRLSMVRFGNVLGSSGSVVPLFRQQIASGGPITLTHPEIVRFFMTIPEAAQLVLQAAVLARGGDLFLLDMGEPVRIKSLAEQMLRLSGLTLRDANHPDGDIEMVCTGLRPGEKLYEELLIDADSEPTDHPLIYRASERSIPPDQLWPLLERISDATYRHDVSSALSILAELVPEWQRSDLPETITKVC